MSFLSLSSNIVRLRKEKGITQETLAEFVGVTKTSVSKWETGTTTPDIQTLPVLAAFFDVSVDDLLGYEAQLSQQQTRYYYHKLAQEFAERDFEAIWEESMELVKKYYCCYSLLMQMAILWLNHSLLVKSESQKAEVLNWTEKLCNHIVEGCEDSSLCENAVAIRALVWLQEGRSDLVIDSMEAEMLDVNRIGDKSDLLPLAYLSVGNYSMAEKSSQIDIYRNLMELVNNCIYLLMSNQCQNPKRRNRTISNCEDVIISMNRYIALLRGVNISGKNKISMSELKASFLAHSYIDVLSYLNSGNIIFCCNEEDNIRISSDIRTMIKKEFELDIPVLVILQSELKTLLDKKPDWWGNADNGWYDNLIFAMPSSTPAEIAERVGEPTTDLERISICEKCIFWSFDKNKYSKANWWKKTASAGIGELLTIRTANTLKKIVTM